jgi:carbamoyl-phosphate synthase small subunit
VAVGEAVFNTAMTGYQEIVTDPSYAGQVVVLTTAHVGNYGSADADDQASVVHARALVTRSLSRTASSWRADRPFDRYLVEQGIVALSEIDTRRLTRHLRDRGAMPVAVGTDVDTAELVEIAAEAPTMHGQDLVSTVTTSEPYSSPAVGAVRGRVVAYDLGIKRDILAGLNRLGFDVTVVPASTTARDALAMSPDGVFLSNGPGDPEPLTDTVQAVRSLLGEVPLFGICLGHQVLGLAVGATTFKLPFGHHGGNHPVKNLIDGTVDITSQNHGFAVDLASEGDDPRAPLATPFGAVQPTHFNLNDHTNEGLACLDLPAFSVQYHPEAAPGPHDALGLFDRFAEMINAQNA